MDIQHSSYQVRRVARKEMKFATAPQDTAPATPRGVERPSRWGRLKGFLRQHRKMIGLGAGLGLLVMLLVGVFVVAPVQQAYANATALKTKLEQMQVAAKAMEIDQIRTLLDESHLDILAIQADVKALSWMKAIPFASQNLVAVEEILTIADGLFLVVQDIIEEFLPLIEQLAGATEGNLENSVQETTKATELGAELLARLDGGEIAMADAKREITLSLQRADRINTVGLIGPIRSTLTQIQTQLSEVDQMFTQFNDAFEILPILLGADTDQTYLIAIQNNTELRATGGFLGNYGLVTISGGKIGELTIEDIYSIDTDPLARAYGFAIPYPLGSYLSQQHLHLRDANFWPDVPTSAERMLDLFTFETGITPNGVIFVDPIVIEDLIRILGAIEVPGYGITVDENNVTYQIQYQVHHNVVSMDTRKDFVGIVGEQLMARLFESSGDSLKQVLSSLQTNLQQKHLQLYSQDPSLQAFYCARGWCGEVAAAADDYLMINETSIGINKANFFVNRSVDYAVTVGEERATARVRVDYQNDSKWGWPGGPYTTYLRVYAPLGSELMGSDGFISDVRVGVEYDGLDKAKTVFSGIVKVNVTSSQSVEVSYRLPEGVALDSTYSLTYQKQAGTPTIPGEGGRRSDPLFFQLTDLAARDWMGISPHGFEMTEDGVKARVEILADTELVVGLRDQ